MQTALPDVLLVQLLQVLCHMANSVARQRQPCGLDYHGMACSGAPLGIKIPLHHIGRLERKAQLHSLGIDAQGLSKGTINVWNDGWRPSGLNFELPEWQELATVS